MEELKPLFPVDFTENGDTTSLAIEKHIKELNNVYLDLTDVYEKILAANADAAAMLKRLDAMGNVVSRNTGTAKGSVPVYEDDKLIDANISGKAAGLSATLPVTSGGTGMTDLAAFRNSMGLGNTLGVLPIANGGTGVNNAVSAMVNLGGALQVNDNTFKDININRRDYNDHRDYLTPNIYGKWLAIFLLGQKLNNSDTYSISFQHKIASENTVIYTIKKEALSQFFTSYIHGFFWRIG